MKKINKLALMGLGAVSLAGSALAEEFDAVGALGDAATNVGLIATAIGGLLAAAVLIYAGFLGYRKFRESMNKA